MLWIVGFFLLYLLVLLAAVWISIHPIRIPAYISPAALDAPQENIEILSEGNRLKAWWVEAENAQVVLVFAHGYMMNKSELTPEAVHWWRKGFSGLLFDHRAQGGSTGKKCGFGYLERKDIPAVVAVARQRRPTAKIVLVGSSMGSAAITLALAEDPTLADALILDSCYSRLIGASLGWWRFLGGKPLMALLSPTTLLAVPFTGFNPFKVDVAQALAKLDKTPILFLHGDKDNLALPAEARRNVEAHKGPHAVVWFEGCGHCEGRWIYPEKYRQAITDFLSQNHIV